MPHRGPIVSEQEIKGANSEVLRGALVGAARWGVPTLAAGVLAYCVSPLYRNLTIQFKVFIQMSGMTAGGVIEGDRRLREYELRTRRIRQLKNHENTWKIYEADYAEEEKKLRDSKK